MKNFKNIMSVVLFLSVTNIFAGAISKEIKFKEETFNIAEQVYDKMVISTRIIKYTNRYIDSKKQGKPNVPDNVWLSVKNEIDYDFFKSGAIQILNNNLTNEELNRLVNDFKDESFIPIPNSKIKKELNDLGEVFQSKIEEKVTEILSANGF